MFPSAPDVQVFAPSILFAGAQATAEIVIEAKKETKVEYIDATLTGHQGWRISSNNHSYGAHVELPRLAKRLMEVGVLSAGTNRFRVTFALPERMPPSHELAPAWARVELYVRVAIPWWPDGKYRFLLPVRLRPGRFAREPYAMRSAGGAGEPRMELSLASRRLVAGETVVGSVALFHVDDRKPRDVELTLVPTLALYSSTRTRQRRGPTLGVTIEIPAGSAGTSVPFHFKLPADITPTFNAATHDLAWWLVARTGSLFGTRIELTVPIEIHDASAAEQVERLAVAPRLSDARTEAAFARFCDVRGWRRIIDDDDPDQLLVEREHAGTTLRLGYTYRGKDGAFVLARVAYPLGLGLDVTPSTPMRELLTKDIEIALEAWDAAHRVIARSAEQAVPFLRAAVHEVQAASATLGRMQRWTDDEIVFERSVVSLEARDLDAGAQALERLASRIAALPMVPPPGLIVDVDEWRNLAHGLKGTLTVGDLSIAGELDLLPVDIGLEFDERGKPVRIRAAVGDPAKASERLLDAQLDDAVLADWPSEFVELQLERGVASAALRTDVSGGPPLRIADAGRVRELVRALRALIARLDPAPGPYR